MYIILSRLNISKRENYSHNIVNKNVNIILTIEDIFQSYGNTTKAFNSKLYLAYVQKSFLCSFIIK